MRPLTGSCLDWRLPHAGNYATYQVGIYSGCYKLSLLITLFVQAFRMGAEPFFFRQSVEDSAQRTYARVMKFFVILVSGMFLFVALYIDIWKWFMRITACGWGSGWCRSCSLRISFWVSITIFYLV